MGAYVCDACGTMVPGASPREMNEGLFDICSSCQIIQDMCEAVEKIEKETIFLSALLGDHALWLELRALKDMHILREERED